MDYVKVWCSVNECGEPIELFHCIQLNRFFFRMHEETDMLISLREEEMGKR